MSQIQLETQNLREGAMKKEEIRELVEYTLRLPPSEFVRIIDDIVLFVDSLNEEELKSLIEVLLEKLERSD